MKRPFLPGIPLLLAPMAFASPFVYPEPDDDAWMYPSNFTPGTRSQASTFSALPGSGGVEDRWGFFLVGFNTAPGIPAGLPPRSYLIRSVALIATTGQDGTFQYDPSDDSFLTYATPDAPASRPDADVGRPVELHGAGFRNGFTAATFTETSPYGAPRNAYPLGFDESGNPRDVSWNVSEGFESRPWAVGQTTDAAPGAPVPVEAEFTFDIDPGQPGVGRYLRESLAAGRMWLTLSSLHPAIQQGGQLASWLTRDDAIHQFFGGLAPRLVLEVDIVAPLSITRADDAVTVNWPQFPGYTFRLEASPDLSPGSWIPVHQHEATFSSTGMFSEPAAHGRRFFRLLTQPTPNTP